MFKTARTVCLYFLVAVSAAVGDQAIAGLVDAEVLGDLRDRALHGGDLRFARLLAKILGGDIGALGDHQDVDGGLRPDIGEGEDMSVLVDLLRRNLAGDDLMPRQAFRPGARQRDLVAHGRVREALAHLRGVGRHVHARPRLVPEMLFLPSVRARERAHREAVEKVLPLVQRW